MAVASAGSSADQGRLPNLLTSGGRRETTPSCSGKPSFSGTDQDGKRRMPACSAIKLPEELELEVRNTFINTAVRRSPSLDGFFRERGVATCPSARVGILEALFGEGRCASPAVPDSSCRAAPDVLPETPCDVQTPSFFHGVRTPCAVDVPLEQGWHRMSSYALPDAWSQDDLLAYQGAPCAEARQYYTGMLPQVQVDSLAVSAVGHLAGEEPPLRTVVKLADSLQLNPSSEQAPDRSAGLLEGLGVARASCDARPAEGYLPEVSWSQVRGPLVLSQLSPWAEQKVPSYGGVRENGVPLYSAPSLPPLLPAAAEAWGAAPDMPAPLQSPGRAPKVTPSDLIMPQLTPSPPSRPALGTNDLPSIGSQVHALGMCKPCAFLHTKGCENGLGCPFCHLCESGEKKRRRKVKQESQRQTRKAKQADR